MNLHKFIKLGEDFVKNVHFFERTQIGGKSSEVMNGDEHHSNIIKRVCNGPVIVSLINIYLIINVINVRFVHLKLSSDLLG